MKDRLLKLLGIKTGEETVVLFLLTLSVFLGIFFGSFDISAHSFFLSVFDEKMMARAYVLSGIAGILLTSLYTIFQRRLRFSLLAAGNLVFITLLTFFLWVLLVLNPERWVIWLVFIMLGPLNILALLGFWGTAGRLFTLRQGKRLFGLVDAGIIAGIILSCYSIPVLLSAGFSAYNILLVSAGALMAGSIVQIITGKRFDLQGHRIENESGPLNNVKKKSFLRIVRDDRYILTMSLFIILSVMTAFFVQYSFMAVTREQYPAEEDLARFLGLFTGSMMIFTLLVKLLASSYLIRNYGLKTCLLIAPVLIGVFTVFAALTGLLKGYTPAASGFMLFFMLLAMSRLFSKSLKDSLESPSMKVIYQSVDERQRFEVQSGMDGTVNEVAALTSGLILAGLGMIGFMTLIHFSLVLIFITGLWIFTALRLYTGYRDSIRKALDSPLREKFSDTSGKAVPCYSSRFSSMLAFRNDYYDIITGNTELLKGRSEWYYNILMETAESGNDINLLPALRRMAADSALSGELRERSASLSESLDLPVAGVQVDDSRLLQARMVLGGSRTPRTTEILRLLRDKEPESRLLAVYMIGKFGITDMLNEVCLSLLVPGLSDQAEIVLMSFGNKAQEELQRFSLSSSGNVDVTRRLLRLLGSSCREANLGFIFPRLWSGSRLVREAALRELSRCRFIPGEEEKDRLHQLISEVAGILTWNLTARSVLNRNNDRHLCEVLNSEIERWYNFLFDILSITCDPVSVQRIKENLDSATVESVSYALEMIDMVVDEQVKPRLVPLLDMIPDEEKIRQLFQFYPAEIPAYPRLLEDFINRDYNLLGTWIRACVLRNMKSIDDDNMGESVAALLFSPELLLREEAAGLLGRSAKEFYGRTSERISPEIRNHLNRIIEGKVPHEALMYEKTGFLASCFGMSTNDYLIPLASAMFCTENLNDDQLPSADGYILWQCSGTDVRIVYGPGNRPAAVKGKEGKYYILPLKAVEDYCIRFPENSDKILDYIEAKLN